MIMMVVDLLLVMLYVAVWIVLSILVTVLYVKTGGFDPWEDINGPGCVMFILVIWPITFAPLVVYKLLKLYSQEERK